LNREALRAKAAFTHSTPDDRAQGSLKSLCFVSGASAAASGHPLRVNAGADLRLQRLLGADKSPPIAFILSPGKAVGVKSIDIDIDIDPAVQVRDPKAERAQDPATTQAFVRFDPDRAAELQAFLRSRVTVLRESGGPCWISAGAVARQPGRQP
jgi:hypothetical protein